MDEIKNKLYKFFTESDTKNMVIAWNGGGYSALLWYIAYRDLNLKIPVVFIDDGTYPVPFYSFIESTRRKYNLDFQIIQAKPGEVMAKLQELAKDKTLVTGKKFDFSQCPIEDYPATWNYLKIIHTPVFQGKRSLLGL
jgi:3'-phosphoadenosine 5'-phosphosulfate sulfotransferase (PAPS reductase)/FAD synthetase